MIQGMASAMYKWRSILMLLLVVFILPSAVLAQTGNSSTISGTVLDPSGAVVANATVTIHDPVSGYERSATTDKFGNFSFPNVPFNPYHFTVTAKGFSPYVQDVDVSSSVPLNLKINMELAGTSTTVTVQAEAGDLLETTSTTHTDIDRSLIQEMPLENPSSSVSSLVTLATPGIAADSNGLFHGLGDHADNSFSVDGQPITDQQSKVFSNQIPLNSVQSMEVVEGAPPAEYGDKTSVVIDVTTRSGQGVTTPHGSLTASYGTFGTANTGFDLAYGGQNWGNFISASGLNTGRFLDPPEFTVMHDKGNEENLFDRVDLHVSNADSLELNFGYTRSWFQNPNSFDAQDATAWSGVVVNDGGIGPNGQAVGPTDERSEIQTFNIAPSWTRLLNPNTVFTLGAFVRRDGYNYYPSADPFADLGPPSLSRESVSQDRTLANAGLRSDIAYDKGINNIKAGATYEQTFLTENDNLGIVDPTFNAPCLDANGVPVQGFTNPLLCPAGDQPNVATNPNAPNTSQYPLFNPVLLPYDLTRGGSLFAFNGHTDVKELALYVQDAIKAGNWNFQVGIRGDLYNGITSARQAEPRLGIAYNIKPTNTVLRISYARTLETPFNENLILSSIGCASDVLSPLLLCSSSSLTPISPGYRNEFHAGFQQAFGKFLVFDGEYIWKYTHNAYDFSVLGNTPITFPIEWDRSKIPGYAGRVSMPNYHGLTALVVFSSVAARFFEPQVGGAGATPTGSEVFRIDHDEKFNQTTHLQYRLPWKNTPWIGFNWRYDSGLVAGATPCFGVSTTNDCPGSVLINGVPNISMVASNIGAVPLSADQEYEAGFTCNGVAATPIVPLPFNCPASEFSSKFISVPAAGTENDDHNPPRIQSRSLFDMSVGDDNLFHGDRYKWSLQFTAINLADKVALYNFLSTFSGTHYVTPRTFTGEIGFHF
ncbi:MAG: TonB-dependent receptor [Candidatus Acidiferrales bacterium]